MSQYQNLPISTSTSTKKNIQYSTRSVPVQPKYWQYQYLVPVQRILTKNAAKFEIFEKNQILIDELVSSLKIQVYRNNFELLFLKLKFQKEISDIL